jgi:hypothetical protein
MDRRKDWILMVVLLKVWKKIRKGVYPTRWKSQLYCRKAEGSQGM